jgi:glycine cleavage system H lipoate-binding protein
LWYTEEHEWVKVEGEIATIGITEYAQGELGDVVFVELPQVGAKVQQMQAFGTIEAVKAVSDLLLRFPVKWLKSMLCSAISLKWSIKIHMGKAG